MSPTIALTNVEVGAIGQAYAQRTWATPTGIGVVDYCSTIGHARVWTVRIGIARTQISIDVHITASVFLIRIEKVVEEIRGQLLV
jgi:hypothetical protein